MMYTHVRFALGLLLALVSIFPTPAAAGSGLPDSTRFGYGAQVDLWGQQPEAALRWAGQYRLDWVSLNFIWDRLQTSPDQAPDWTRLDSLMKIAQNFNIAVLISISSAPDWAMGTDGPDPQETAQLITSLSQRYPGNQLAVELFPGANTLQGWGKTPNPEAYLELITASTEQNASMTIVTGGLLPAGEISDEAFLTQLYESGGREVISIVGLQLRQIGSDPLNPRQGNLNVLRHYEAIHEIMLANDHTDGLIWITGFSWDQQAISGKDQQAAWLKKAYLTLRSQLFIGAAFFDGLNGAEDQGTYLLFQGRDNHPGFGELIQLIAQEFDTNSITLSIPLVKRSPKQSLAKFGKL